MARKRKDNSSPENAEPESAMGAGPESGVGSGRFAGAALGAFEAAFPSASEGTLDRDADIFEGLLEKLRRAGFGHKPEELLPMPSDEPESYWRRIFQRFAEAGKWGGASGFCELMRESGVKSYAPYVAHWNDSLSRALDLSPYGFSALARELSGPLPPAPIKDADGAICGAAFLIKSFLPLKLAFFGGSETMEFMTGYAVMWRRAAWDFIKARADFITDFSMVGELRKIYESSCDMTDKSRAWKLLNGRLEVLCGSEPPFEAPDGMADIGREGLPDFMPDLFLDVTALAASGGAGLAAGFRFGDNTAWACASLADLSESNAGIMEKAMEMGRRMNADLKDAAAGKTSSAEMLDRAKAVMDGFGGAE